VQKKREPKIINDAKSLSNEVKTINNNINIIGTTMVIILYATFFVNDFSLVDAKYI
jgi:hypothetical protein